MMRSAPSVLIPGRPCNCSLLALFTSRGWLRVHPSLTPSANAFASCLISDVACAVFSRTSSGLDFCWVHAANRRSNTTANAAIIFTTLRCTRRLRGWSRSMKPASAQRAVPRSGLASIPKSIRNLPQSNRRRHLLVPTPKLRFGKRLREHRQLCLREFPLERLPPRCNPSAELLITTRLSSRARDQVYHSSRRRMLPTAREWAGQPHATGRSLAGDYRRSRSSIGLQEERSAVHWLRAKALRHSSLKARRSPPRGSPTHNPRAEGSRVWSKYSDVHALYAPPRPDRNRARWPTGSKRG